MAAVCAVLPSPGSGRPAHAAAARGLSSARAWASNLFNIMLFLLVGVSASLLVHHAAGFRHQLPPLRWCEPGARVAVLPVLVGSCLKLLLAIGADPGDRPALDVVDQVGCLTLGQVLRLGDFSGACSIPAACGVQSSFCGRWLVCSVSRFRRVYFRAGRLALPVSALRWLHGGVRPAHPGARRPKPTFWRMQRDGADASPRVRGFCRRTTG